MKVIRNIEVKVRYREVDEWAPGRAEDREQAMVWDAEGSLVFPKDNGLLVTVSQSRPKKKAVPLCYFGPMFL